MMKATTRLLSLIAIGAVAAVLAAGATASEEESKQAKLGKPAPDFTLYDTKGQERSLGDYKGRLVVLEWINPQCPYVVNCYKSKAMQGAYDEIKQMSKGAVWLAINTTSNTTAEENTMWVKKYELEYPILLDTHGTIGRLYDARRTPHMFVIDSDGILRYHGAIDNNKFADKSGDEVTNYVVGAVRQVVEGETVAPDYVKPYGCTVKYPKK